MKTKRLLVAIVSVFLLVLSACSKLDFSQLSTDMPYVGQYQGKDCVVVLSQADEGLVKGRVYFDNGSLEAEAIEFSSDVRKNGKGHLYVNGNSIKMKKVGLKGDILGGEIAGRTFVVKLAEKIAVEAFHPDFKEPIYESYPQEVTYAKKVKGYWSSYQATDDDFGSIYIQKVSSLRPNDLDLDMDLYQPISSDTVLGPRPLLLLIHGGAFYNGDKKDKGYPELGNYFAERGYVVASVNYRLGFWPLSQSVDRAGYRAVQDVNAAVRYLLKNKEQYNIDPDNIFVAGSSAGAITALNVAFMNNDYIPEAAKGYDALRLKKAIFISLGFADKVLKFALDRLEKGWDLLVGLIETTFRIEFSPRQGRVMSYLKNVDLTNLVDTLGISSNLGPVNQVNHEMQIPFNVKAVVNMWGAVHNVEMLQTSPQTAILSFHSEDDHIVPYDTGYPFDQVLDEFSERVLNAISFHNPSIYDFIVNMMPESQHLNELAFRKMYGSKMIDGYVRLHKGKMRRSELHTVPGERHSLQHGNSVYELSPYFNDTIVPVMTRFLYEEVVGGKAVQLQKVANEDCWYEVVDADNVAELHWNVEGGAILQTKDGHRKAKVLLFADAPTHSVTVCGKYKNGVEFRETMDY